MLNTSQLSLQHLSWQTCLVCVELLEEDPRAVRSKLVNIAAIR